MFQRKPRYLIDQNGELRRIYHRQGRFFPYFGRSLRPDTPNLSAVEINGKWVLVEVDGNEQKKATELKHAAHRRQSLLLRTVLGAAYAAIAWNGPFGHHWIGPAKAWVTAQAAALGASTILQRVTDGVTMLLLDGLCLLLALLAVRHAFAALKFLLLEILYRLGFPFMKGARADLLPTVPRKPLMSLNLPWKADFENPLDAARLMAAGGAGQPRGVPTVPKQRRLTGT
jgi:hypothetical protein